SLHTCTPSSFVLHDTPTSVIYTLSLHDALPIYFVETGEAGFQRAQRLLQAFLEGAADGHGLAHRLHRGGEPVIGALELFERKARDRKSTRLNSSHVKISYAVFCLKKKKHKQSVR